LLAAVTSALIRLSLGMEFEVEATKPFHTAPDVEFHVRPEFQVSGCGMGGTLHQACWPRYGTKGVFGTSA
jgi:hypothetical protein